MPSSRRIEKLNILFREELARILDRKIEFPEGILATVTRVALSPNARHAAAYISVLGGAGNTALAIIEKNVYDIQQMVNRAIRMRPVPQIAFHIDEEEDRRERVEKSLAELKQKGDL